MIIVIKKFIIAMKIYHIYHSVIWGLLPKLTNFTFLQRAQFGHFVIFPVRWGWKSRLKTISSQLRVILRAQLGNKLAIAHRFNDRTQYYIICHRQVDTLCLTSIDHLKERTSNISTKYPWNSGTDFKKQLKHFRPFQALC